MISLCESSPPGRFCEKGLCRVLHCAAYRQKNPVKQEVVVRRKNGLAKKRGGFWFPGLKAFFIVRLSVGQ